MSDTDRVRRELTVHNIEELRSAGEVETFLNRSGTSMIVVNTTDEQAGPVLRGAVSDAISREIRPDHMGTVLAGEDEEATRAVHGAHDVGEINVPSVHFFVDGSPQKYLDRDFMEEHYFNREILADEIKWAFDRIHTESSR